MKLIQPNNRTLIASPTEKILFLHGINILHTQVKLMCPPQVFIDIIKVKILFSL